MIVGDQDQFVHLWRYAGGYANIDDNLRQVQHRQSNRTNQAEYQGWSGRVIMQIIVRMKYLFQMWIDIKILSRLFIWA